MKYDVYSYGIISTSTLLLLEGNFPEPDLYAGINDIFKMIGGEASNSSIVLSKLGLDVKLDGNWIGNNVEELETKRILENYHIDTSNITIKNDYKGPTEVVVATGNTRTIFGTYGKLYNGDKPWNKVNEEDIINSKIVCLDPFFGEDSKLVSRLCVKNNKPYITVDCRHEEEIAKNAEVIIISGEFRSHQYPNQELREVFELYRNSCNGLVILTSGDKEILFSRKNEKLSSIVPYFVEVVDTAGAGDSFRAGVIYGLINKWNDAETVKFASALAALVCGSFPGVLNSPKLEEIYDFMNK